MSRNGSIKAAFVVIALLVGTAAACSSDDEVDAQAAADTTSGDGGEGGDEATEVYVVAQQFELSLTVTSSKFNEKRRIPRKYSCTEEGVSPPITWSEPPQGTVGLALVVDSDQFPGPPYVHWVVWGIPSDARALPEAVPNAPEAASIGPTARQGTNGEKEIGWVGPCPPPVRLTWTGGKAINDPIKHYVFKLYALDTDVELGPEATKEDLLQAIDGHILAGGELMGDHVSKMRVSGSGD